MLKLNVDWCDRLTISLGVNIVSLLTQGPIGRMILFCLPLSDWTNDLGHRFLKLVLKQRYILSTM